jgi:predicted nucleotidyltransferase component of viral defense system
LKDTIYFHQANLVLDILPIINRDTRFALKGGTAINFFIRPLPRVSVDIDLAYLPIEERESMLRNMDQAMQNFAMSIKLLADVEYKRLRENNLIVGLFITRGDARIKIEPNLVIRGSVFPVETHTLIQQAQDFFEKSAQSVLLSFADLYGGKLCAALDRQHPRDLFDIKLLLENEGITEKIRQAFIVYLVSHNRPIIELLNPNPINLKSMFELDFRGMTFEPIVLKELEDVRNKLFHLVKIFLSEEERHFILSIKSGLPDWSLFPFRAIEKLPAVQWKLENVHRMPKEKHIASMNKLRRFLEL